MSLENILRLGIGFFLSVWLARHLGAEQYGYFSYVISFVTILLPLYSFANDEVTVKRLIENENHSQVMTSSFILKFLGSLLSFILLNIAVWVIGPNNTEIKFFVLVYSAAMMFQSLGVINNYFQSLVEEGKTSMIRNIVFLITAGIKGWFIYSGHNWKTFVYISCFEVVLAALFYLFYFFVKKKEILKFDFSSLEFHAILKLCSPFLMVVIFEQAMLKIDQIMVGEIVGAAPLGEYAVANKLVNLWNFVPIALISSLFPGMMETFTKEPISYQKRKFSLYGGLFWISFIFAIGVTLIGQPLVDLLYGEKYPSSGQYLRLYSWITIFSYFYMARSKVFIIENRIKLGIVINLAVFSLNIFLNFIFIKRFGALGAIYGTFCSFASGFLVLNVLSEVRKSTVDFVQGIIFFPKYILGKLQ